MSNLFDIRTELNSLLQLFEVSIRFENNHETAHELAEDYFSFKRRQADQPFVMQTISAFILCHLDCYNVILFGLAASTKKLHCRASRTQSLASYSVYTYERQQHQTVTRSGPLTARKLALATCTLVLVQISIVTSHLSRQSLRSASNADFSIQRTHTKFTGRILFCRRTQARCGTVFQRQYNQT